MRQSGNFHGGTLLLQVSEYFADDQGFFDAGNDLDGATAITAGFYVDKVN